LTQALHLLLQIALALSQLSSTDKKLRKWWTTMRYDTRWFRQQNIAF
jgi:hypothetical protein